MLVYARMPVIPRKTFVLKRALAGKGKILVKVGQRVRPEEIVIEGKCSSGFRTFELDEILRLTPLQAERCLVKTVGSRVFEGDLIAETKQFLGLRTVRFLSPITGIFRDYNVKTGHLTIEYLSEVVKIAAGVSGKVIDLHDKRGVDIEANVAAVDGVLGSGKEREGTIKVIANRDIPISAHSIDSSLEGKIIVGGALLTLDVVYRCLAVKVRGIVCGGIHFSDYQKLVGSLGRYEDIGVTLLITDGFGQIAMQERIYGFLQKYEGHYSLISGSKHQLFIPLSDEETTSKPLKEQPRAMPLGIYTWVHEGDTVKIIAAPHFGREGIIDKIEDLTEQESGITCQTVKVRAEEGKVIEVPIRNVEVIR